MIHPKNPKNWGFLTRMLISPLLFLQTKRLSNMKKILPIIPFSLFGFIRFRALRFVLFLFCSFGLTNLSKAQNCAVNAGISESYCMPVSSMQLEGATSGFNIDFQSIHWTVQSQPAGASVNITNPLNLTTAVTGTFVPGVYTFRLNANCTVGATFQDVSYTVHALPTQASVPSTQIVNCYTGGNIVLSPANNPGSGETATWSVVNGQGSIVSGGSTAASANLFPNFIPTDCRGNNQYTTVVSYTISNAAGCSTSDYMNVIMTYAPGTVVAKALQDTLCGRDIVLAGSCNLNGTGNWTLDWASTTGATASFDQANAAITPVTVSDTGSYVFSWTVGGGCRPGSAQTDTVYLYDCPIPCDSLFPVSAGEDIVACSPIAPSMTMDANALPQGATGEWTQLDGDPLNIQNTHDPKTIINGFTDQGGPYRLIWAVTNSVCYSYDTLTIRNRPGLPALNDFSSCSTPTLSIFTSANTPFQYMDTFYIQYTLVQAPDSFTPLERRHVIIDPNPQTAAKYYDPMNNRWDATSSTSYDTLSAIGESYIVRWGRQMPGVSPEDYIDGDLLAARFKPGYTLGTYVFDVEYSNGCQTYSERVSWHLGRGTNNPMAVNAGTDVIMPCGTDSVQLAGNNLSPNEGRWAYASGPGPNPLGLDNFKNQFVTAKNLNDGVHQFVYSEHSGLICKSNFDTAVVYIASAPPTAMGITSDADTTCNGGEIRLYGNLGTGSFGKWSIISGNTTGVNFVPHDSAANVRVTGLSGGQAYIFQFDVSNACGAGSVSKSIYVLPAASPPTVSLTDRCEYITTGPISTETIWTDQPINTGNILWTTLNPVTPYMVNNSDPTNDTTTVGAIRFGANRIAIAVSSSDPACPYVNRDTMLLHNVAGTVSNASNQVRYCNVGMPFTTDIVGFPQLQVDFGAHGFWSVLSGPGIVQFNTSQNEKTANVTFDEYGVYTLRYIADESVCWSVSPNYFTLQVTIADTAFTAFAGLDDTICGGGTFNLDALDVPSSSGSEGLWTVQSVAGSAAISLADPTDANTSANITGAGSVTLRWETKLSGDLQCEANYDEVTIYSLETPNAGSDISLCDAMAISLEGNPNLGTLGSTIWSKVSGAAGDTIYNPNSHQTVVGGLQAGNSYTYRYTLNYAGCSLSDDVQVDLINFAEAPSIEPDTVQCAGSSGLITLVGNAAPTGVQVEWSLSSFPAGMSSPSFSAMHDSITNFSAMSMPNGVYNFTYRWSEGACEKIDVLSVRTISCNEIGDVIWNDTNRNGTQDVGELGMSNVKVILYDGMDNVLDSVWTNANGNYLFSELPDGDYKIGVELPYSYVYSPANQGPDVTDSDIDQITGLSGIYNITGGTSNRTVDGGVYYVELRLPVVLTDFKARLVNCTANLSWSTLREENTMRFDIVRADKGSPIFKKIGTVAAHGHSSAIQHYEFVDSYKLDGSYQYKLNIIDLDGTQTESNTVSLLNVRCSEVEPVRVFPNPVHDHFTISFTDVAFEVVYLVLTDMQGRVVYKNKLIPETATYEERVSTKGMTPGLYLLNIIDDAGYQYVQKINKK